MPNVEEILDSRTGSRVGVTGLTLPRIFRVTLDSSTDDPVATLQRHASGVPFKGSHPWNNAALAFDYNLLERESPKRYLVEVVYEIPTDLERGFGIVPGWTARFRGFGEPQPVLQEVLDDPPIPQGRGPAKQIGTPEYILARDELTATHFYTIKGTAGDSTTVYVRQSGAVLPHAVTRLRAAATMVLDRDVNDFWPSTFGHAVEFIGKTNFSTFFGALPGQVQFVDITLDPRSAQLDPPSTGSVRRWGGHQFPWHVTLTFVWSLDSRALLTLVDTVTADSGAIYLVQTNTEPPVRAETTLQIAQTAEMSSLVGLFR